MLQVRQTLVEDRHAALEAIRAGFCFLDLADHLEHFSGVELATLFFGEQYLDVDALVRAFCLEGNDATGNIQTWLKRLSECYQKTASGCFWHVSPTS